MFFGGFPFDGMPGGSMPHSRSKEPVDTEKLYKLLDLSKDCSESEIKKAYRKLAIKHHPDKGGDPEKFKEISKAYEILSDPDKRRIYDEHGEEGLDGSYTATDASDIFDLFFGGSRKPKGKKRGEDIVSHLKVSLEQIYNGTMRKLAINKDIICNVCDGHGGPKDSFLTCSSCNGQGIRVQIRQMGSMIHQTQTTCSSCNGQGKTLPESKRCKNCSGKGVKQTKKILEVFVEKGVPDQHKITFHGEADERPNEIPGSVIFVINQNPHDTFKRNGNDLFMTKAIPLYQALTGCTFYLTHLDDRILKINTPPGEVVKPGSCKVITGEGMPIYKSAYGKGNLYVTFDVIFPVGRTFTPGEKEKLLELFPFTPETPAKPDTQVDEYTAQHFDLDDYKYTDNSREYEEDEAGPTDRVQCRQQ
ncbi:Chaperone protein dnaJ 3 [Theileria parva strain Muguga]|uniref:DnaJ protein, putative n=1 Tax=Theileria parva TaxID=5875 RepID=Q4N7W4_THEPA|nr:chaperone protein DnaJ [Theileria parva strain Muguga]EAN33944.1 Chaperone protein dnaJ 3 [Theileria parva strain Muguga]|eukprot:XP_766227.1 chaperone protein DnaJ [Theileria parva strain Muguga]